jgi:hypothetical protein
MNKQQAAYNRKKRFPAAGMMDKDDEKYIKQGHTLVNLQEHFSDNQTTITGEGLERQRWLRNKKYHHRRR